MARRRSAAPAQRPYGPASETASDGKFDFAADGGAPRPPRVSRDRNRRDPVLVEDYVQEALAACIRSTCGLSSSRPMARKASVVTARVIGDKGSRSRAIVLRQGPGKRDASILWVSSRDGILRSCFYGHENALFLSASSRSPTCRHTMALRQALSSSDVSAGTFCSRMRLRADAADVSVCEDDGSTVLWSISYHSVFSLVTFSDANVATCVAPCCRRFRRRCGHVRVARERRGPDGFNDVNFGTTPAAVKAPLHARRRPPPAYDKVIHNEEEYEGLEKLASDTMRFPQDSAPVDLAARPSRNLLPSTVKLGQGAVWNRTADLRQALKPQAAGTAPADRPDHARKVQLILSSMIGAGAIRDTRDALVEHCCGSCGQNREERHKVVAEPGLLTTHHPTAPALKVCRSAWLSWLLVFSSVLDQAT